ncbi:FANCD2 opposite strand protein [Rhinoderma darwinii]|uniref:FANCD2 opposite strand protein n=1 Tax=Rhinoderma darwinii TaxID=43563 RepID=UPI003F67D494
MISPVLPGQRSGIKERQTDISLVDEGEVMASYQLWSPWTPLDESLQYIRGATPRPCGRHPLPAAHASCADSREFRSGRRCAYKGIIAPHPLPLRGLDVVFSNFITVQPPRWCGSLCVSDTSAFSRVIGREQQLSGFKGTDVTRAVHICKQLLRAILLLYTIYKKCTFTVHQC